jgi:CheY-like chemotaxis protein
MTVVIVLTSSQHRSDIENACALGANSYLVKPANPLHLKSMMQAVQSYWLQLNHPTVSGAISRVAKAGNAGAITRVATQ